MASRNPITCAIAREHHQYPNSSPSLSMFGILLTSSRWVLAEVLLLIPAEEALGLRLRCSTTGKLAVELDYSLHASSITSSTETL